MNAVSVVCVNACTCIFVVAGTFVCKYVHVPVYMHVSLLTMYPSKTLVPLSVMPMQNFLQEIFGKHVFRFKQLLVYKRVYQLQVVDLAN